MAATSSPKRSSPLRDHDDDDGDAALGARVLGAPSLYDVLQVPHDAPVRIIRQQYLMLSRQLHPDKCHLPRAKEAFQTLSHAYHTLADDQLRRRYDQTGHTGMDSQAHDRTLAELADQLLREFWNGNFENILLLVDILNASNPELHLQKDTVAQFLETTRSTVQEADVFIKIVRADTIKLWELKTEFEQTSWLDVLGLIHIGVRTLQVPLLVMLSINQQRPVLFAFLLMLFTGTLSFLRWIETSICRARTNLRPAWNTTAESIRLLYTLLTIPVVALALVVQHVHSKTVPIIFKLHEGSTVHMVN